MAVRRFLIVSIPACCVVLIGILSLNFYLRSHFKVFPLEEIKPGFFFSDSAINYGFVGQQEISGISPSANFGGDLWGINDSGNGNFLYLYNGKNARLEAMFKVNGTRNLDWEDIAFGKSPDGIEGNSLYIADIGDNKAKRKAYSIYAFKEPNREILKDITIQQYDPKIQRFTYVYEDGPRDAEALAIDPFSDQMIIITKRETNVGVYALPIFTSDTILVAEKIAVLPLMNVVAADISKDGMEVIIKTYDSIYYWQRQSEEEGLYELFSRAPFRLNYNPLEPQGESICLTQSGFYTLSEKAFEIQPRLYFYPKK